MWHLTIAERLAVTVVLPPCAVAAARQRGSLMPLVGPAGAFISISLVGIAGLVERSPATAKDVSAAAPDMQATSLTLCGDIPAIVRNAVPADLREYPRYDVNLRVHLEHGVPAGEVAVQDVSEGGARIVATRAMAVGAKIALTFPGMTAISGKVARAAVDSYGISFAPSRCRWRTARPCHRKGPCGLRSTKRFSRRSRSYGATAPAGADGGRSRSHDLLACG